MMDLGTIPILKKDFYVYCHQKKDDGKCFYIGKGKGYRAYSKSDRNNHWHNTVKKHNGFDVVILVNCITEEKAFELEEDFIAQIGLENLVNMTSGGEGVSGMKHTIEARKKMSIANKGRIISEDTRLKLSLAKRGRKLSIETRQKMGDSKRGENSPNFGKKLSEETRKKMSDARKNISNETRQKLSDAAKGRVYSEESKLKMSEKAKGRKKSEEHCRNISQSKIGKNVVKDGPTSKPVSQYNKKGDFINTFTSITEASQQLNILKTAISNTLSNRSKSAGGYIWKYHNETI